MMFMVDDEMNAFVALTSVYSSYVIKLVSQLFVISTLSLSHSPDEND
jgi:hypothetical protein